MLEKGGALNVCEYRGHWGQEDEQEVHSLKQVELISKCHFNSYLDAKMDMFSDNIPVSSDHLFSPPATSRHCQVLSVHCSDGSDVLPISLPFLSFTFAALGGTSHLQLL